jgi:hypothetical protein
MKNLQEQIQHQKKLMNIISKSDVDTAGTWSPKTLVSHSQGKKMYVLDDGRYVEVEKEPSRRYSSKYYTTRHKADSLVYLFPEDAERINDLINQAKELESQAKILRQQAKDELDISSSK